MMGVAGTACAWKVGVKCGVSSSTSCHLACWPFLNHILPHPYITPNPHQIASTWEVFYAPKPVYQAIALGAAAAYAVWALLYICRVFCYPQ